MQKEKVMGGHLGFYYNIWVSNADLADLLNEQVITVFDINGHNVYIQLEK